MEWEGTPSSITNMLFLCYANREKSTQETRNGSLTRHILLLQFRWICFTYPPPIIFLESLIRHPHHSEVDWMLFLNALNLSYPTHSSLILHGCRWLISHLIPKLREGVYLISDNTSNTCTVPRHKVASNKYGLNEQGHSLYRALSHIWGRRNWSWWYF